MTTFLAQNQFISNSDALVPEALESGAVNASPPSTAAPVAISVSEGVPLSSRDCEMEPLQAYASSGMAATDIPFQGSAAADISDIPEIFRVAHQLCEEARTFVPDYPGIYQAMLDPTAPRALEGDPVWADETPLFLREDGYLQRWEA